MRNGLILIIFFIVGRICFSQHYSGLFMHTEYQVLKYDYLQIGLGHSLKNNILQTNRKNDPYCFTGYTLSYSKNLNNSDWGLATQYIVYSGTYDGPIAVGIEFNYKSITKEHHFGIKPIVGLSFPIWSITYGYNFDMYGIKDQRLNQHELIVGLRLRVLKWK